MATNNAWNSQDPAQVALGGTGDSSLTAYAVLCGGTTSTAPVQSIASVGTSGQVLTSNGVSALPTFQARAGGGALVLLQTLTASSSASLAFTNTFITTAYSMYFVQFNALTPASGSNQLIMSWSINNGSTYLANANFAASNLSNPYNSNTYTNTFDAAGNVALLTDASIGNVIGISGFMNLYGLAIASFPTFTGQMFNGAKNFTTEGSQQLSLTVNNIKFAFASGNIASGTISLYGISN